MNGKVVITFNSAAAKENFVCKNSLRINNDNYAIQDTDCPLTFFTIYNAPFELSDLAIVEENLTFFLKSIMVCHIIASEP